MTVVLCRKCGRKMDEVPSGWVCIPCGGRIEYTPNVTNSAGDKRQAIRERDARLAAFRKKMNAADWDTIQKAMGLKAKVPE